MLAKVSPKENSLVFFVYELLMLQQEAESSKNVNGFINNHDGSARISARQNCRRPG